MGSHTEGQALGLAAEAALANRHPQDSAMAILERLCERYRGLDIELESTDPENPHHIHRSTFSCSNLLMAA
jgi:meiotically up-regulated gene 157 (Mug157) protein